ncbi:MAG: uroporphyrinogen decarboxylase family protein [Propionivibrio sp.]
MDKNYYIDLARQGRRMPIATHLVLHEKADPEAILLDGARMAAVMLETAERFDNPLALPVMDLTLEKDILLRTMGVPPAETEAFHFTEIPDAEACARVTTDVDVLTLPRIKANCEALSILRDGGKVIPVGMSIGPFSLLTKLIREPITAIYMAGSGVEPEDDDEVAMLHTVLKLCETIIQATCAAQIKAGARAIFLCEPAANLVFFSPKQIREGSTVYDDFVTQPNLRLKKMFDEMGVDLLFHDCGELIPEMITSFGKLNPKIISFGSPVKLWEVEQYVAKDVVMFGNLPTKKFYSDEDVPLAGIEGRVAEIEEKLRPTGHPFIISSECDVLSMPGYEKTIMAKVNAMCGCGKHA